MRTAPVYLLDMINRPMRDRPSGVANPWLQLWLSVACVLIYELLQKRGATETANLSESWSWTGITALASPLV